MTFKFNIPFFKKKKVEVNPLDIPPEILEEFNEAERRMEESGGQKKPYQILFDIYNEKRLQRSERRLKENGNKINTRTDTSIDSTKPILPRNTSVESRSSIQTSTTSNTSTEHSSNAKPNSNTKRRVGIGRGFSFRRR